MHRGAYFARAGEHKAMRFKTLNQRRSAATRGRDESSRAAARAQPRVNTTRRAIAHKRGDRREAGAATRRRCVDAVAASDHTHAAQQMSTRTLTRWSPHRP